jgi:hypothetical protein
MNQSVQTYRLETSMKREFCYLSDDHFQSKVLSLYLLIDYCVLDPVFISSSRMYTFLFRNYAFLSIPILVCHHSYTRVTYVSLTHLSLSPLNLSHPSKTCVSVLIRHSFFASQSTSFSYARG